MNRLPLRVRPLLILCALALIVSRPTVCRAAPAATQVVGNVRVEALSPTLSGSR